MFSGSLILFFKNYNFLVAKYIMFDLELQYERNGEKVSYIINLIKFFIIKEKKSINFYKKKTGINSGPFYKIITITTYFYGVCF